MTRRTVLGKRFLSLVIYVIGVSLIVGYRHFTAASRIQLSIAKLI